MNLPGPETARAAANFGGGLLPAELIRATAEVKLAALESVQALDRRWEDSLYQGIRSSCEEIIRGEHDALFPISLRQGGAGTSIHMNLNEVLAELTLQKTGVKPDFLEDLARYQSTNDVFSSAVNIVALRGLSAVEEWVIALQEKLVSLETEYDGTLMTGRTEMQDALPISAGQLFGSWAGMAERDRWRISKLSERVREISLGGTAVGTCFNAPAEYINGAVRNLRRITGLPLSRSQNLPDAIAHKDSLAELGNGYSLAAGNLITLCDDLLFYSSSAVGEIRHPELQWGSSIMPVKVNPVLLEFARGLALRVDAEGRLTAVYARDSRLQLNAMLPFLAECLLNSCSLLIQATEALFRFLNEMTVDTQRMERNLAGSPAMLNALMPRVGYHRLKPLVEGILSDPPSDLREFRARAAVLLGIDEETLKDWLQPECIVSNFPADMQESFPGDKTKE